MRCDKCWMEGSGIASTWVVVDGRGLRGSCCTRAPKSGNLEWTEVPWLPVASDSRLWGWTCREAGSLWASGKELGWDCFSSNSKKVSLLFLCYTLELVSLLLRLCQHWQWRLKICQILHFVRWPTCGVMAANTWILSFIHCIPERFLL